MNKRNRRSKSQEVTLDWLFSQCSPVPFSGCWLWTRNATPRGYGCVSYEGRQTYAHRVAIELKMGRKLAAGHEPDHLCRVPLCINPDHLEEVTHSENMFRGTAGKLAAARSAAKTHCPSGHPYSGDNLIIRADGSRKCRECGRIFARDSWRRKRGASEGRVAA